MLLITGANGRYGRLAVEQVLGRMPASELAVSVRDVEAAADLAALGVDVRHGDFDDPASLVDTFTGVRRMLLVSTSGMPHTTRFDQAHTAITAAASAGVSDVVYTSLLAELPPSISDVHRRTEQMIIDAGVSYTFLRHPLYTENFLDGIAEDPDLVSCTGSGAVATASRADLAEAAAITLAGPPSTDRTFDLTGPHAWTHDELAAEVGRQYGVHVTHRPVSRTDFEDLLRTEGVPDFLVEILADINSTIGSGAVARVSPDLATLLGRPGRTLAEAMAASRAQPAG